VEKRTIADFSETKIVNYAHAKIVLIKTDQILKRKGKKTGGFEEVSRISELQEKQDHEMVSIGWLVMDARSRLGFILLPLLLLLLPPPLLLPLPLPLLLRHRCHRHRKFCRTRGIARQSRQRHLMP